MISWCGVHRSRAKDLLHLQDTTSNPVPPGILSNSATRLKKTEKYRLHFHQRDTVAVSHILQSWYKLRNSGTKRFAFVLFTSPGDTETQSQDRWWFAESREKKKSVCVSAEKGAESERWRSAEWRVRVFMRACLKQAGANLTFSSFRRRWRRGAAHTCSHRKHGQGGSPSAAVIQDKSFF